MDTKKAYEIAENYIKTHNLNDLYVDISRSCVLTELANTVVIGSNLTSEKVGVAIMHKDDYQAFQEDYDFEIVENELISDEEKDTWFDELCNTGRSMLAALPDTIKHNIKYTKIRTRDTTQFFVENGNNDRLSGYLESGDYIIELG